MVKHRVKMLNYLKNKLLIATKSQIKCLKLCFTGFSRGDSDYIFRLEDCSKALWMLK